MHTFILFLNLSQKLFFKKLVNIGPGYTTIFNIRINYILKNDMY